MGNKIAVVVLVALLFCLPVFAQQEVQQIYTRAEMQELSLAYRGVILRLETQLQYYDQVIRSVQAQLIAYQDYQTALEENNKVLRELAGQGKKRTKLDWLWFGVKTGATVFTACELTSIC